MSMWTHITGAIIIDTNYETEDIVEYAAEKLKNAPLITGSEIDAQIIITSRAGYNTSTSCDCNRCKYKDTIKSHKTGGFSCAAEENYDCPHGTYQTCIIITIAGDLRDRSKEQTQKEYKEFEKFLTSKSNGCGFPILNKSIKIVGW